MADAIEKFVKTTVNDAITDSVIPAVVDVERVWQTKRPRNPHNFWDQQASAGVSVHMIDSIACLLASPRR